MILKETSLPGLVLLQPRLFPDARGYFTETFNARTLLRLGLDYTWVQDNQARSTRGVLRGLHYQRGTSAQAKLVRVLEGRVLDAVVDLRADSPTYGQSFTVELSAENHLQMLVPRGFAHGYAVLSETATFFYKCDNFYDKSAEAGLYYADPKLRIDWKLSENEVQLSQKDEVLPTFGQHQATEVAFHTLVHQ